MIALGMRELLLTKVNHYAKVTEIGRASAITTTTVITTAVIIDTRVTSIIINIIVELLGAMNALYKSHL